MADLHPTPTRLDLLVGIQTGDVHGYGQAWRPGLLVTCPVCAAMERCPDCDAELEVPR